MAIEQVLKDLGAATAYAYAVEKGYTGTEAEFAELMASYASVAQSAAASATAAAGSATSAASSASTASTAASTATTKASQASASASTATTAATTATTKASEATTAAQTATTKAGEASTSASTATSAKDTAVSASQTATTKATEATTAAATATSAATTATTAKDDAVSAKTAAQTAQTGAETAAASVSASAAQIATNAEDISQLKSELSAVAKACYKVVAIKGESANASGVLVPFIAKNGDSITAESADGSNFDVVQLRFYDASKTYIDYWSLSSGYGKSRTFTYNNAKDACYVGITTVNTASPSNYVVTNNSNIYEQDLIALRGEISTQETALSDLEKNAVVKNIINRFDKTTITEGYYLSANDGTLVGNSSFFASDYIDVSDLENIMCSGTHIVCFYKSDKSFISGQGFNTGSADASIAKPSNAIFMRFSAYKTSLDYAQIGANISRATYVPYGKYTLPDLIDTKQQIVVDASGNGDYTSLTLALFENVDSGIDIVVKPGTYDIVEEYVALFGQTAVNNMADSDSATFNGFQYGVIIRNRKITFEPGSHVVCDWTGHTVDGTHRFSAIRVDYNAEIVGLNLVATATFYAIHDDYGLDVPYTVKYTNCKVEGINLTNANCIGGGCKKYSRHILDNCYFNNNLTGSATVRYHNTNDTGAEPEIYVSNCYFNNWFTPRWYGAQTSKMKVYVNNCEARSIHKLAESSSFNVDNVELYKWCNTETNPIT